MYRNRTACGVSGLDLVYTVALDADGNMGYTDDLNKFLYWSGCYGVPDDVTVRSCWMIARP
mgnify:CR=1 FL=1